MLCCDGYPPRKSFFFPFFSLYIYFCFHYNENRRPRRPAKYFARSQKLTPYPFSFFFYPSSFDFALKRERNRIELESEEREKKMFSLLSTGTELLYVESLGCIFACIVSVSQQNVFGIHTRGGSWLTLTWLETSFGLEFDTRYPIEFCLLVPNFLIVRSAGWRNRIAARSCATVHQRIGHYSKASSRKLHYYNSSDVGLAIANIFNDVHCLFRSLHRKTKTKTKWNKHPSPTYAVVYVWIKFSRKSTKIIRIFWKISICFNRFKRWGRLGRWVMKY